MKKIDFQKYFEEKSEKNIHNLKIFSTKSFEFFNEHFLDESLQFNIDFQDKLNENLLDINIEKEPLILKNQYTEKMEVNMKKK